jgi:hypothetical protein
VIGPRRTKDFVRAELRHALEAQHPDRTAMLNRIAANRAADSSPARSRRAEGLRLAGSALAVLAVLGLAAGVRRATSGDDPPAAATVVSRPATHAPTTRPPASAQAIESETPNEATTVRGHTGDTKVEKGSLWSDGSVTADGESTVTLKPGVALTELHLTIRVTRTPGLADRGAANKVPGVTIDTRVEHQPDALLYHFVLRAGETLPAGRYVFIAHYRHDGNIRDADADTYEAFSTTTDRKHPHVYGNFSPSN